VIVFISIEFPVFLWSETLAAVGTLAKGREELSKQSGSPHPA